MMKSLMKILLVLACGATQAHAGISVKFEGDCANGKFDAQDGDIEFLNLNLDILDYNRLDKKVCEIVVQIPKRSGYYIAVNKFKVEGFTEINDRTGWTSLTLKHKTNGDWFSVSKDTARETGPLTVVKSALSRTSCGQPISFRTRIEAKASNASFFQDSAQSRISFLKYNYVRCESSDVLL